MLTDSERSIMIVSVKKGNKAHGRQVGRAAAISHF